MGTNYPGAIDSFTNPTSGEPMNSPSHATQHANANAAIEAIETYVGISGSASLNAWSYGVLPDSTYTGGADPTWTARTLAWKALFLASYTLGIPVFVPAGTYSSNYLYEDLWAPQIYCLPYTVNILMQNQPYGQNYGWNFGESNGYGTTTTLTTNAAKYADVLSLTALPAGIVVGSIISVADTSILVGGNSDVNTLTANNFYRVLSITGTGPYVVTIAGGIPINGQSYGPAPQGLVYPISSAHGVVSALPNMQTGGFVRGLNFIAQGGASNVAYGLYLWQLRDVDVDVTMTGFGGPAVILQDCWKPRVRASINQSLNIDESGVTGQYGYGVQTYGATCHAQIDVNCDQARHAVSLNGTGHNISITGVATNTLSTAWDAHAGSTDVLFHDVTAVGCANGVALRGDRYRLIGGNIDNCQMGVLVFDRPIDAVIKGAVIRNCSGNSIFMNQVSPGGVTTPGVGLTIDSCDIQNSGSANINFSQYANFTDVLVTNTNFLNAGLTTGSPHVLIATALTRAYFERCTWRDNQGSPTTTAAISCTVAGTDITFDGLGIHNSLTPVIGTHAASVVLTGSNTSIGAASTPTLANGTAAQLAQVTSDSMLYLTVGTAGTSMVITIGPTSTPANTVVSSSVATAGELYVVRVPAGWYVKWAATTATIANQLAVTC
jgi:hypothetical protein